MLVETFPVCNKKSGCSNNFGRLEYIYIYIYNQRLFLLSSPVASDFNSRLILTRYYNNTMNIAYRLIPTRYCYLVKTFGIILRIHKLVQCDMNFDS